MLKKLNIANTSQSLTRYIMDVICIYYIRLPINGYAIDVTPFWNVPQPTSDH